MNAASERLLSDLGLQQGQPVPSSLGDLVHESLQKGRSVQVEYTIASCHYIISVTPLVKEQYANLYWTDITERKRTEEALRISDERFRTLGDHMAQLAWMIDQSGDAVWFNRRWYECTAGGGEQSIIRITKNVSSPVGYAPCQSESRGKIRSHSVELLESIGGF
jgi:PAS domain-containing protein